ncbi:protein of unknown function [Candidatus Methylomirabilis oxygeniifera]|uniref:Uncharacterized protein n=1 Tax=Methylomirabilis oxygeniifera TaxID=671143 RepID=D5MFH3_METO1|nr:protein of unknown function [Candidatus Methylomirabilis oxyfera]
MEGRWVAQPDVPSRVASCSGALNHNCDAIYCFSKTHIRHSFSTVYQSVSRLKPILDLDKQDVEIMITVRHTKDGSDAHAMQSSLTTPRFHRILVKTFRLR